MGISAAVGINASVLLLLACFVWLREQCDVAGEGSGKKRGKGLLFVLVLPPLLHASLVGALVAIASHPRIDLPLLLGKRPDGSFPLWSTLVFAPFLLLVRVYLLLKTLLRDKKRREAPYSEVSPGLYVGRWPDCLPPGRPAVVDCTCELRRSPSTSNNPYLRVAVWDTRSPQPSDIEATVRWVCRQRAQNDRPVYIHCAFGHGRSVCIMCAVLVALGIAEDWKTAEEIIRQKHPFIRLNALQRKSLEEWSKYRLTSKRRESEHVSKLIMSKDS